MTLNDPKYNTDFAHTVWQVSTQRNEFETLDFLSENAARSIAYLAAKHVIDTVDLNVDPDTVLTGWYLPAEAVKTHALGSVLSNEWRSAFGREFMDKVRESMLARIEREKHWAIEREEREARIAAAKAERKADEKARARKVLGLDA